MELAVTGSALVSGLAVLIALVCLFKLRRQAALTEKTFKDLKHEMEVTNNGSMGMGRRLLVMEKAVAAVKSASVARAGVEPAVARAPVSTLSGGSSLHRDIDVTSEDSDGLQAYTLAAELLESGLDADAVARRCGLSRAEISLMQLMQNHGGGEVGA